MRSLFFKRAKIFLLEKDGVNLRYNAVVSGNGPVPVPNWVTETLTYQHSVKDGSILDLTVPSKAKPKASEIAAEIAKSVDGQNGFNSRDGADVPSDEDPTEDEPSTIEPVVTKLPTRTPKGLSARGGAKS